MSYLREIEHVRVRDCEESVDRTTEGVDLLVGVPHKDLPTWLRQNYIHDSCNQRGKVRAPKERQPPSRKDTEFQRKG